MSSSCARLMLAGLGALALGLGSTGASASFVATAEDPAGDAATPEPGRDLTAVGLGYDRATGRLAGAIRLRGAPEDAPAAITLVAASRTAGGCDRGPAIGFGSATDAWGADWLRIDRGTEVTARGEADKRGGDGAGQEFEVTDRRLAGLRPDCVIATLTEPGNPQNVYDQVGPLRLVAQPSLALRLAGIPEKVRADRTYRLKVVLSNPGDAPTGRIQLRVGRARGVSVSPANSTLKSIAGGKRTTAMVTVRLGARARTATELRVTATAKATTTAGRLTVTETLDLFVEQPGRRGGGGSRGGGGGQLGLCTRWIPDFSGESGGSLGLVPCEQ